MRGKYLGDHLPLYLGLLAAMMLDWENILDTRSPTVPGVAGCHDVGCGDYLVYHLPLYLGLQAAMMLDGENI